MTQPNVIVFMMDALRPDHLGPWGPPARPSPNFQRMADEGVFFRNFFSHMPSSHPGRASILTGRDPHTCGIRINSRPLAATEITLTQILRDNGYLTATSRAFPPGLGRGFDEKELVSRLSQFDAGPWDVVKVIAESSTDEAQTDMAQDTTALVKWLKEYVADSERSSRPFFFWADVEDTHEPWCPPAPFDSLYTDPAYDGPDVSCPPMYFPEITEEQRHQAIALYDGVIALEDKYLGILMDTMDQLGLSENTLLIVCSDHGMHLGEHHLWRKPPTLIDPVLRATLIMRQPGALPKGVQTESLALTNDVFATVLDHIGIDVPEQARESCASLIPLWKGADSVRDFIPLEFNYYKGTVGKGIRTDKWKYVYYPSVGESDWDGRSPQDVWTGNGWAKAMLFDLVNDPGELENVIDRFPEIEKEMKQRLIDWLIASENDVPAPIPGD
jgi:arylsulfatase